MCLVLYLRVLQRGHVHGFCAAGPTLHSMLNHQGALGEGDGGLFFPFTERFMAREGGLGDFEGKTCFNCQWVYLVLCPEGTLLLDPHCTA